MNWINFLHFYQPPVSTDEIMDEVIKSSYKPWADFLSKNSQLKVTLNFTACLTERLHNTGQQDLLDKFAELAQKGQIEFVESAAFHPILPLLPEREIVKQIKINHQINSKRFGEVYQPQGFFLPEMAYSDKVAKIIKDLGYKYLILDEISLTSKTDGLINNNLKYKIKDIGLEVVFRNRKLSQTFVPKELNKKFKKNKFAKDEYIITATDGELYGHHYWDWYRPYSRAIEKFNTLTISEYLNNLSEVKEIDLLKSSWESLPQELKNKQSYKIWHNPKNKLHKKLWKLANFALKLNWDNLKNENHFASRIHLEKGLASCTFWWASGKDFMLVSPHAWQTSMVEVGAHELLNSIRSLENINYKYKLKAEKIYRQIHKLIWDKHWKK